MKYECDMVRDLLPLYQDSVCSEASRKIVEEHLQECSTCQQMAERIKDATLEQQLIDERESIVKTYQKKENRKAFTIGIATAGVLLIPVVICLICNIAIGHALDWFFIVLTAMLLVGAILVVPLVVPKKKFTWTVGCATAALLLLLLTCCIYTKGDWFGVTAVSCILGISVVFLPYSIRDIPLPSMLRNHKAALTLLWDCIWLYLLLIICGFYVNGGKDYWQIAFSVTTYVLLAVWLWLFNIRYLRRNAWIKAGVTIIETGFLLGISNDVMNVLLPTPDGAGLAYLDFSKGMSTNEWEVLNANLMFLIIVVSLCVGIVFLLIGKMQQNNLNRDNLNHDNLSWDNLNHDNLSQNNLNQDNLNQDNLNRDNLNHDDLNRDNLNKNNLNEDNSKTSKDTIS